LKSLILFEAQNNDFSGALPPAWTNPKQVGLALSNNAGLTGALPPSLFAPRVTSLVIEGTSLSGSLPASLCAASSLVTLALSGNALTGQVIEIFYCPFNHLFFCFHHCSLPRELT
jgi:hypothetical protein